MKIKPIVFILSVQPHPREERNSHRIVAIIGESYKPLTFLLIHTVTIAMLFENSIQTGLGGSSAPATIKQFDPSLTDTSNQIAVQVDISNVGAADDFSIVQLEVNTIGDGFVHLLFDLTHGLRSDWWWEVSSPPDVANIRGPGPPGDPWWTVCPTGTRRPGLVGSDPYPGCRKLEAVRPIAGTRTETGKSVDSGCQVGWIIPCSQNRRKLIVCSNQRQPFSSSTPQFRESLYIPM